jgi:serine/threonine protein kinase
MCPACLLRLATRAEARAPEYEIETLLGSGRSGTTYLAREADTGALLAVKLIPAREDSPDPWKVADAIRDRLIGFQHPSVASTHAVDVDDEGNVRLVRDYVTGKPLAGWVAQADAEARGRAWAAIAAAVEALDVARLFHGHIAAPNVVIAAGGRPVLVDLGAHMALRALHGASAGDTMAMTDRDGVEALREMLNAP